MPARLDRAELRDRDLEVRQELEQERLELVVGAVDLVDQQHHRPLLLERVEQRALEQELAAEQAPLGHVGAAGARLRGGGGQGPPPGLRGSPGAAAGSPSRRAPGAGRCPGGTAAGSAATRWPRPEPSPPRSCRRPPRPPRAAAAEAAPPGIQRWPAPGRAGSAGTRAPARRPRSCRTSCTEASQRLLPAPRGWAREPNAACTPATRSGRRGDPCHRPPAGPPRLSIPG